MQLTVPSERAAADAQIVSGLRLFVPLEKMQGRMVVVLTNLKPAKMCALRRTAAAHSVLLPPPASV